MSSRTGWFTAAGIAAAFAASATVAEAGSITGITAPAPGLGSFAGGVASVPLGGDLSSYDADHQAVLANILQQYGGGTPHDVPSGAKIVGGFVFDITSLPSADELLEYQSGKVYEWTADFDLALTSGSPENGAVETFVTTTVTGAYADVAGNWNYDADAGVYSMLDLSLWPGGEWGMLRFALTDWPTWWTGTGPNTLNSDFVNPDGFLSYNEGFPNSAYVLSQSRVEITAVPTPAAAGAALMMISGLVLARRRGASAAD